MDRIPSIADPERDNELAKWIILKSAYERDFDANRDPVINISITIREISDRNRDQGFGDYLDVAKEMNLRESDPLTSLIGNTDEGILRITDVGRNYYEENKHLSFTELDF